MEIIESIWQVGVLALLAGAMIGALAYRFLSPSVKQSDGLKSELDEAKRELSSYKASVNSHFNKTSELVNDLTQNYVKVYQHLAEGAQALGGSRELNDLLEQQQGKVLLAVDDKTDAADTAADAGRAESSPIPEAPARTANAAGEQAAGTSAGESEPEDRKEDSGHTGAPATTADAGEPEEPGEESPKPRESAAASNLENETEPGEPVVDVSKIDRRGAADEDESNSGMAAVVPGPEEGREVKPTRH